MPGEPSNALFYKRSHFVTHLPLDYLYSPSHYWLARCEGSWRIGLTKFASRMLGEIVDYGFEVQAGASVRTGEVLGWIEGFKAVSDVFCVIAGQFNGGNPHLKDDPEAIGRDCYGEGWLYAGTGQPDPLCLDAQGYKAILDATIDKLVEKQKPAE